MDQLADEDSPFSLSLRAGGLYDTRVGGSSSAGGKDESDAALAVSLDGRYRIPVTESFGFQLGYSGYADFHDDYDEYDVVDQTFILENQWQNGNSLYSLILGYNIVREDGASDYQRLIVSPVYTRLFPEKRQAFEIYGNYASINDDDGFTQDEDGHTYGAGCAYVFLLENDIRLRFSLDYLYTVYDSSEIDYVFPGSRGSRRDKALAAGADIYFPIKSFMGLYLNYTYINTESNVSYYDYDRNIIEGGVSFQF
jgi:hypothetical protein